MLPKVVYQSTSTEFEDLLKGKYELVEKIGKGSYGDVYRALCMRTHRHVAIKRTRHHSDGSMRCVLEPVVMRSVRHPYLLSAEEVIVGSTVVCIVMPLALDDVGHYLQRNPKTPLSTRLMWCWQLCQALATLHQSGVVHGDLKDVNCLIMPDQRCVLADFTLSVLCPTDYKHSHTVYTFTHRPPELFENKSWGFPADAWALGCTLYEIIYSRVLFPYQAEGRFVTDERSLYTKALACFRQFAADTQQKDAALHTALLGRRVGKWFPATVDMNPSVEYEGINSLIMGLLRIAPSDRLTLPQVLAHPVWDRRVYPLHGYMYMAPSRPTERPLPFDALPPTVEAWLPYLRSWATTWGESPPAESSKHWVWASLYILMKMLHVSAYCVPPDGLKEVLKIERYVLEAAEWSIPWKIWWDVVPATFDAVAASPRAGSPPRQRTPSPQELPIPH